MVDLVIDSVEAKLTAVLWIYIKKPNKLKKKIKVYLNGRIFIKRPQKGGAFLKL